VPCLRSSTYPYRVVPPPWTAWSGSVVPAVGPRCARVVPRLCPAKSLVFLPCVSLCRFSELRR
jgi:hypothetical protein